MVLDGRPDKKIFVVDLTYSDEPALVSFPFEYLPCLRSERKSPQQIEKVRRYAGEKRSKLRPTIYGKGKG